MAGGCQVGDGAQRRQDCERFGKYKMEIGGGLGNLAHRDRRLVGSSLAYRIPLWRYLVYLFLPRYTLFGPRFCCFGANT